MPVDPQSDEFEPTPPPMLGARRSRKGGALAIIGLLVIATAAAAYAWLNYDGIAGTVFSAAQPAQARPVSDKETVALEDFQAFQRQTTETLKSLNDNLISQKADAQRLSEQVAALAAKLDAMQSAAPTTPPPQAVSVRPAAPAVRKKPPAPRAGPISTGGAPLPSNAADGN
jgi:uncharacterized coiled-coil protein SlyX